MGSQETRCRVSLIRDCINTSMIEMGELNEVDRHELMLLLNEYVDIFGQGDSDVGVTDLGMMEIHLTTNKPVSRRPYRLSHSENEKVRQKIKELLDKNIIKESNSQYASPIIAVPKKNGEIRLCVDYRELNKITVKDKYPLPLIEEQLDKLAGKRYFTSLDLVAGFHQIPIHPNSTHITAFVTPDGLYEYLRVPMGLCNSPAVFQRAINKMLGELRGVKVLAYIDDLLIPSETVVEGLEMLRQVLEKIRVAGFKLNVAKCSFLQQKLEYLGHEVTVDGVKPGVQKIQAVKQFPVPTNVVQIRQFVGLASYFRKYVRDFATIARPLTQLTKKNVTWSWGDEQNKAFEVLKEKLSSRPVLVLYNSGARTEVHTDASKFGLGGMLLQEQGDKQLKPVMYFSKVTTAVEQLYHSYDLETLAVVETIKRFRVYLIGVHFKLVTDCTALRATFEKKDMIPRVARWWLGVQEYDFSIEYRPGVKMQHVDALSRNPVNVSTVQGEGDWFLTVQLQDEGVQQIYTALQSGIADKQLKLEFKVKNGRVYRRTLDGDRLYVPTMAAFNLLRKCHDDVGHPGFEKCLSIVKRNYWFPKMRRFVKKYVSACIECAFSKGSYGRTEGELHPIEKVEKPFDTVHVDHLGPFMRSIRGNAYILVLIDAFTKFVVLHPVKTVSAMETIRELKRTFGIFGCPRRIISDRGKAFDCKLFKEYVISQGVKHVLNAIATPRANGQVERTNRVLIEAIMASIDDEVRWDEVLPQVAWGINNSIHSTTRQIPSDLMFAYTSGAVLGDLLAGSRGESRASGGTKGKGNVGDKEVEPQVNKEVSVEDRRRLAKRRLDDQGELMRKRFNSKHKPVVRYKRGDLVLWRGASTSTKPQGVNSKLVKRYGGPYCVVKVLDNNRYQITAVHGVKGYKNRRFMVAGDSLRRYRSAVSIGLDVTKLNDSERMETDDLIDLLES